MSRLLFFGLLFLLPSCQEKPTIQYHSIEGETMGTYYRLTFGSVKMFPDKSDIEVLLEQLNLALSTYLQESVISRFNHQSSRFSSTDISDDELNTYFSDNVRIAYELYDKTDGYYDPTVMPLVNYWGFGYQPRNQEDPIDTLVVLGLLDHVGLDKLKWDEGENWTLTKSSEGLELDFSASAKGYAIDQVALYLESEFDIADYLVDIGGESKARGFNAQGEIWKVGISIPKEESALNEYGYILSLNNTSVATSGNYRNFYVRDGETISHTMNPRTGFYERNNLLSVSIVTTECAFADGYATACMAMGLEKAIEMVESEPSLEGMFIFVGENGMQSEYITTGLRETIEIPN